VTADDLTAALRARVVGLYPLEAGVALLISDGTFLHRNDFTSRFITCATSDGTPMAAIYWDAATTALASGGLPVPAANAAASSYQPALPPASVSSGTASPDLMTTALPCWSPPSGTQPENDRQQPLPMTFIIQASTYGSNVKSSTSTSGREPSSSPPRGMSAIGFGLPIPQESQSGIE
jgi:hypothetical protein